MEKLSKCAQGSADAIFPLAHSACVRDGEISITMFFTYFSLLVCASV